MEYCSDSQIISSSLFGKNCLFYRLCRYTDDLIRSKLCSYVVCFHITLSDMYTIGVHFQCNIYIVIDHKRHPVSGTKFFDFFCFFQEMCFIQFFFSQLYECRTAFQRFLYLTV